MQLVLQPADYVLCAIAIIAMVTGLFRGFSGTLAFLLAAASSIVVGLFSWPFSASFISALWARSAVVLILVLLSFGIVRLIVKKLVNKLLAQPSDAIFGAILGAIFGSAIPFIWAWTGFHTELSSIASAVVSYVR